MDDFSAFPNVTKKRNEEEELLLKKSDLSITSSNLLFNKARKFTSKVKLISNAGEFDHFNKTISDFSLKEFENPIIGYFGAVAEWFDTDLIEFLANNFSRGTFIIIGHTFGADIRKLQKFKNIKFLGELPYFELPKYLHNFDVCIIPFKITTLTKATLPVKVFEFLAAGKPVVTTKLPELDHMKNLVYIAETKDDFLKKINVALQENDEKLIKQRIEFAAKNTWKNRFEDLVEELKKVPSLNLNQHRYAPR